MNAISELQQSYFLLKIGIISHQTCIDWAMERLLSNQEGDDFDIVFLAITMNHDEVLPLVEKIIDRYIGLATIDDELVAGKYIALLHQAYQAGKETVASLDEKFTKLYYSLGYPNWLVMLSRNCEYATDIPDFLKPFEDEFEYVANLWVSAESRNEFESRYSRDLSNQHDIKYC
ncbi:MAG: hypothetical protein NTW85_00415 [Methylococcales bacterium]|nr:hypothetical protein [Methylococcales bacterium]